MPETTELLGPAEKAIAEQVRDHITKSIKSCKFLIEDLEKIDVDSDMIERLLLDSEHNKTIISFLEPLSNLSKNLDNLRLTTMIMGVLLVEPKKEG